MLIDTHTHLYLDDFAPEKGGVVERAFTAGVTKMIFPNVDLSTVEQMKALHAEFPDNTYMAMGLHPTEVANDFRDSLVNIEQELRDNRNSYVAVGEIGIDLYWDKTFAIEQCEAFYRQCMLALELDLPLIIHCRDGLDDTLEILSGLPTTPRGVFHSFGGSVADVKRIREIGDFYFGINGIVTFKKSTLPAVLPEIGLERILLETDSPYLAPVPYRGKRNESAYIVHTAATVANALGKTVAEIADATTSNANSLFGI